MRKRRKPIPLEMRPIGECTVQDIAKHLQERDQVIFVFAAHEVSAGVRVIRVDECAYSGHVFELIRDLIDKAKEHRDAEGANIPKDPDDD